MNNNIAKFYACNHNHETISVQSHKSWWPDHNVLWGHKNMGECEGILVSKADYYNFLLFVSINQVDKINKTYQMDIVRTKNCFGDYWTLSNFATYEGQYCMVK